MTLRSRPTLLATLPLLACALPALAQPRPPAAPALPAAPSAPALPAAPSAPALPASAKPPAPRPDKAPDAKAGPDAAPAGSGAPGVSGPVNADYVLFEKSKKKDEPEATVGMPATLPPEIKRGNPAPRPIVNREQTIDDLTNPEIVSVTGRPQGARHAPGFVMVLTQRDLQERGYIELSEMLDDLPGMEVIRPYGDVFFNVYWRGARTGSGLDPFLLMVDGMVLQHLFYRNTQILTALPISNIERVEIVYNPASATYAPNSAMGSINVITKDGKARQDNREYGTWLTSRQTFGTHQSNLFDWRDSTKQVDAHASHVARDFRLNLSARVETSALERAVGERYEYTKDKYYADKRIWPDAILSTHPGLAGRFESTIDKRAIDGRLIFGNAEAGVQFYSLSTGLGTRFPGDRQQNATPWTTTELNFYGRHVATLASEASLTSLVHYRESNIDTPTILLINNPNRPVLGTLPLELRVDSSAIILQEDLNIGVGRGFFADDDQIHVAAGVRFQRDQLNASPRQIGAVVLAGNTGESGVEGSLAQNALNLARSVRALQSIDDLGIYGQLTYSLPPSHNVYAGARLDRNSLIDASNLSFRGGYTGVMGPLNAKVLFSQAVNTPGDFDVLLGGIQGNEALKEETIQSVEGNLALAFDHVSGMLNGYYIDSQNVLYQGHNLRERQIVGADVGGQLVYRPIKVWAYYTRVLSNKRTDIGGDELKPEGDIAANKVWGGATFTLDPVSVTALGRFVGERKTVVSNPVGKVPAYFTLDASATVRRFFYDALSLSLRVENILGTRYAHPGLDRADAGVKPATYTPSGYSGSAGSTSSLHPQPGRGFFLSLGLDL